MPITPDSHTHARTRETVTVIGFLQSKRVSTVPACCQVELYLDRPCRHCLLMLRVKAQEDKKIFKGRKANIGNDICSSYSHVL